VRSFLLFFICCLGATTVFGQRTSRLGRFTVNEYKGCASLSVTINDISTKCSGTCIMGFGDGGPTATNTFTHTYTAPGTYKLAILYQSEPSATATDDLTITVFENVPPPFNVYTCEDNKVTVKVTDRAFDTYIIDFDGDGTDDNTIAMGTNATAQFDYTVTGLPAPQAYNISVRGQNVDAADNCAARTESFTTLATGTKIPQPTINSLEALDANTLSLKVDLEDQIQYKVGIAVNSSGTYQTIITDLYETDSTGVTSLLVDENFYCFRLTAVDPCAGTDIDATVDVCSQNFDVDFQNGNIHGDWQTSTTDIVNVDVVRNDGQNRNLPGSPTSFDDSDYTCNKDYCYYIVAHYSNNATSTSLAKCGTGKLVTTFPPILNVSAIVTAGAKLVWEADPLLKIETFDIFKSPPGQPLTPFVQSKAENYTDATYDYAGGSCYQVNYGDNCGNRSTPGIIACPMALSGSLDDRNVITLGWNSYKGYNLGVSTYIVSKRMSDNTLIGEYPTNDTTFIDNDVTDENQIVTYVITAIPNEALGVDKKSVSNNITIEKPVRLILPTAFTPNGDGINPSFTISGKFVSKMNLQIFDRWGVLVFASDKNEPWDGTKAGKPMPESAYVWKAEVQDYAGNIFTQQGTVLLLRPGR
jgi:gliding motility-associated-like protein